MPKYVGDVNIYKQVHCVCDEIVCICFEQYPHVQATAPNNGEIYMQMIEIDHLCFQTNANNFTTCMVKLFVQVENVLDEQHRQIMTYAKDHLNPSAGSDDPWHMS